MISRQSPMLQAQRALPRLRLAPVHHRILGEMQGRAESDFALRHWDASGPRWSGSARRSDSFFGFARCITRSPEPLSQQPSEASLMARCQSFAHFLRIQSGPTLVAVRERANSLIADKPCYLRDREVGITQIMRGEIRAELIENLAEA
jgi:hypothetical protein